jgi:ribulose-phosphate 3-epimerase
MSVIIPGILEKEWTEIERKLELIRPFAEEVHIDLIDGVFAENTSFRDPEPFRKYTNDFLCELHIMADDPLQYVRPFAEVGFTRFLGQIEMMPNQTEFVAEAEQYGEVGLVVDARTPLSHLTVSYEDLDALLVMTVNAGFSGQAFLPSSLAKITAVLRAHPLLTIAVDGGITQSTLAQAYVAGARRFVATSAVFLEEDPKRAYTDLSESVARMAEASVLPE